MREHDYHGPSDHRDDTDPMLADHCNACNLAYCKTCRGGECELPVECPGRPMTLEERELICDGTLEYELGVWWLHGKIVWSDRIGTKRAYR